MLKKNGIKQFGMCFKCFHRLFLRHKVVIRPFFIIFDGKSI
jgi:hypothetical protein